jgi:hypothetical protein
MLMIKRTRREQASTTEARLPSRKVISALAQHAVAGEVADVDNFRTQETAKQRAARYVNRLILGPSATKGDRSSIKPDRYDVHGYQQHLSTIIEASVRANSSAMSNELYEAAEQAGAFLSANRERDYRFQRNTSQGAENLGVLRAVTHNQAFITTNPNRAASILTNLGEADHTATHDMFTHYAGHGRRGRVMNAEYADAQEAVPAIAALVHEDALWSTEPNEFGRHEFKAKGALAATSEALSVLSERSPLTTIDSRLEMLARNRDAGEARTAMVDYNLVYSFRTDIEQAQLHAIAGNEQTPETTRGVAQDVLAGAWDGVLWAI